MKASKSTRTIALVMLGPLVVLGAVSLARAAFAAAAPKPGITVQISPSSQSVQRAKTASYTVTLTSTGGFAGSVALSATGLPAGATAGFAPATVPLTAQGAGSTATSALSVTTTSSTTVGSYTLTVTGTSGKVSGSVTAGLTVNYPLAGGLSMTSTPASVSTGPGSTAVYSVQLSRTALGGNVTFGVTGGLPTGATWAYAPNPTTGTTSTLQVTTTPTTADGTYTLYLVASGADDSGVTRYAYASVQLVITTTGSAFTISGNLAGLLSPGRTLPLDLKLTNPNKKALSVTNLSVSLKSVTTAAGTTPACSTADYAVTQYTGPYALVVPGASTKTLSELGVTSTQRPQVTLLNRPVNQDRCKGAVLTLSYSGAGNGN